MKTLYLLTRDTEGDLRADRTFACQHPRKNETDLRQDYIISFELASATNIEEWSMVDVMENMSALGWTVSEIEPVVVQY